jgi:tRNA(Ile)-lysidine synthase
VVALVLDHGQRPAAATEAALAAAWLARHGIAVRRLALPCAGPRPAETLRRARLAVLAEAAAAEGCLHLLLAHQRADQAETVLIRALGGSHPAGLAAMAPCRPAGPVRLVRPLLGVAPEALRMVLRAAGQPWIVDPSNATGSVRARLRAALADRAGKGVGIAALAAVAHHAAAEREAAEAARDRLLAEAATIRPEGFARLDAGRFAAAAPAVAAAALAALLRALGGHEQPVRAARVAALLARLAAGRGGTAARCLVRRSGAAWLICREPAALPGEAMVPPAGRLLWDGRWQVTAPPGLTVGAVGAEARPLARIHPHAAGLPRAVLATLPALRDGRALVAVPPIGYDPHRLGGMIRAVFRPPVPVSAPAPHRVVTASMVALACGSAIPS